MSEALVDKFGQYGVLPSTVAIALGLSPISRGGVEVPFKQVLTVATNILSQRGRCHLEQSMRALVERTKARDAMAWTLEVPHRLEA